MYVAITLDGRRLMVTCGRGLINVDEIEPEPAKPDTRLSELGVSADVSVAPGYDEAGGAWAHKPRVGFSGGSNAVLAVAARAHVRDVPADPPDRA